MSVAARLTLIGLVWLGLTAAPASAQSNVVVDQEFPEFRPRRQRSEADEDRILASTLFADGRLRYRREEYKAALRQYQRAYRYSNGSSTILAEIVPLAFRAGRVDEAARYVLLSGPDCVIDPFILRRLAIALTDREQLADAAKIYERTAVVPADQDLEGAAIVTQFELGRLYFLMDEFEKAVASFDRVGDAMKTARQGSADGAAIEALLKNPDVTFSVMAESYFGANRLDRAEEYFNRAHEQDNQKPLLAYHRARLAEKRKKYDEALRALNVYLDSKQDTAGLAPYRLLARLLEQQQRSPELIGRLESLWKEQPKNIYLGYHLAEKYLENDQNESAAVLYRQLIETQATVDAYRGLVQAYTELVQDEDLLKILAKTVSDLGELSAIEISIAPLIADQPRLKSLFEKVRPSVAAAPLEERRPLCVAMASLAMRAKDFELADEFFELAGGEPPEADPQVWIAWGIEMLLADQHERAIRIFREMVDKKIGAGRRRGEVLFYLSGALAISEKHDEAIEAARRAASLAKGVPGIQARPAWVLYVARRWEDAKLAYEQLLEQYSREYGSTVIRSIVREAKMTLSNICVQLGEHDEAVEWLEQILDEYPGDIGALNDLGYLWADRGQHLRRALRMAETAAEAEPDNIAYLDSVGWALFRLERYEEAVQQLERAVAKDDPDPIILDHLGDALFKSGDVTAARSAWQQAIGHLADDRAAERKKIETKLEQHVLE